jgi:hypothetical protein
VLKGELGQCESPSATVAVFSVFKDFLRV